MNLRLLKKEFVIHVVERLDLGTLSEAELLRKMGVTPQQTKPPTK